MKAEAHAKTRPRMVEVRQRILRQNDLLARELRRHFDELGVRVVSLVSGPGAGKTALLERTLREMASMRRTAVLVGDLATENDAERLRKSGVAVKQIATGTICHLDASMVSSALEGWLPEATDLLLIENVGNLVCPSSYDLGENARVVLVSTTEGEDKPLKYPTIFNTADAAVITKMDLVPYVDFDRFALEENIRAVRPGMRILEVSARTGAGMQEWLQFLKEA